MANQHDKRDWSVLARFPFSKWSCSAFMTYTQAKLLADALEHVGMEAKLECFDVKRRVA